MVMWIYLGLSDWEESQTVGWTYALVTNLCFPTEYMPDYIFFVVAVSWASSLGSHRFKSWQPLILEDFYFWDLWQYLSNFSFFSFFCFVFFFQWRTMCVIFYKTFPAFPAGELTRNRELQQQQRRRLRKRHFKKINSRYFKLYRANSSNSSNVGKFFWSWSLRDYQSSRKEKESRCLVFMFSTKREMRHFHVVVVQRRQRNVQKRVMNVQSCCFSNLNLLLFCRSLWRHRRRCWSSLLMKQGRDLGGNFHSNHCILSPQTSSRYLCSQEWGSDLFKGRKVDSNSVDIIFYQAHN